MTAEENHVKDSDLSQQIKLLKMMMFVLLVGWVISTVWLANRTPNLPPVLVAERLDIVEPDGQKSFVLANSQRPGVGLINGKELMADQDKERRGTPSFIFFNGKGDEVGGLIVGDVKDKDGIVTSRHLSLDAYQQDQTVVLEHNQDNSGSSSGVIISDRPNFSLVESMHRLGLEQGASRDQLTEAINKIPEDQRRERLQDVFGASRAYFGTKQDGSARLELRDALGRLRIVIETPKSGEASIRLFDEQGNSRSAVFK